MTRKVSVPWSYVVEYSMADYTEQELDILEKNKINLLLFFLIQYLLNFILTTGITCVTPSPESITVPVRVLSPTCRDVQDAANAKTA